MSYRIFEKVMTPDNEQGYVSEIFACGGIDVDIRCDESEDENETTSYFYEKGDGVITCIPGETPNGCPEVGDITPYGTVTKATCYMDNQLYVVTFSTHKDYDGENSPKVWLSWSLVDKLEAEFMESGQWTDCDDFDEILDYLDIEHLYSTGELGYKPIQYHEIPEACHLVLTMKDGTKQVKPCGIHEAGEISDVKDAPNLAKLRELGAIDIQLVAKFSLKGF